MEIWVIILIVVCIILIIIGLIWFGCSGECVSSFTALLCPLSHSTPTWLTLLAYRWIRALG